ncbi:MAG TPA: DUF2961 domain-containing protein [bacterium]|nr:DUF2961 domain-containing protein [bacterium]
MDSFGLLDTLPFLKEFKAAQESSFDRTGGNNDYVSIEAGDSAVLADIEGAGCISRIWLTVAAPDLYILRRCVIRMYWDGEQEPSVEAPLGDFFGVGFSQYRHFTALPLGMSSGGYYCYIPMPFSKNARIEVENQSKKKINAFYYNITFHRFDKLENDKKTGRFHARWRHEKTLPGSNYTILEARGAGHYIGCNMNMQGYKPLSFWFLEGDEMIYVDGEAHPPAIHGTGTEDYFNSGWYFNKGTFSGPYHGLTIKELLRARISAYRFHIPDPIPFKKSIRVTIEHGGINDTPGSDYSSTAYWYQAEPHVSMGTFPPSEDRLPDDGLLIKSAKDIASEVLQLGFTVAEQIKNIIG